MNVHLTQLVDDLAQKNWPGFNGANSPEAFSVIIAIIAATMNAQKHVPIARYRPLVWLSEVPLSTIDRSSSAQLEG